MIYYIADTHFGDARVMKLARRPFETVEQMDLALEVRWNARVRDDDDVYIVGDFALSDEIAVRMLGRLRGRKHLILGNHDAILSHATQMMMDTAVIKKITDGERSVVLCHYPLLSFENSIYGGYQVFGHIHNNENDVAARLQHYLPNSLHAGADVVGFAPQTLDELIKRKEKSRDC